MKLQKMLQFWSLLVLALGIVSFLNAQAQVDDFSQPYTVDEHTIVLLHFDNNLQNESDSTADGIGNGNYMFMDNADLGDGTNFGQYIYLDNDARSDSSFVYIPDTPALDLSHSWTIEAWVNVFSVGVSNEDWHTYPKFANKGHNYWVGIMGVEGRRNFQTGYEKIANGWADAWTDVNTFELGKWYHIASIRDDDNKLLMILVHDKDMNLIGFSATPLGDEETERPILNDERLTIGFSDEWKDSALNGLIDELRISNVVRQFPMPPVIKRVLNGVVSDTPADTDIPIQAEVVSPSGTITDVTLYYSTGGDFTSVPMTNVGGSVYEGIIPGQPEGTQISYYITAANSHGFEVTSQKSVMSDSGAYYGIAVGLEKSLVLHLDFENSLYDSSLVHHTVVPEADPIYSTDAVSGDYSLVFKGDETSLLRIEKPAPFLSPSSITVDFWVNPDTVGWNISMIGKFSEWPKYQDDWRFGYRIWWNWWDGRLTAEFFPEGQDWTQIFIDSAMVAGNWYHIIFKVSGENKIAYFELYNANDELIQETSLALPGPLVRRAGTWTLGGDKYDYMIPWRFRGKMDNVRIYNYARDLPPALKKFEEPPVVQLTSGEAKTIIADIENSIETLLHYSTDGVNWQEVAMTQSGDITYTYELPGQDKGTVVQYYITAVNARGKVLHVPASGVNAIAYAEPKDLTFALDFEEGSGVPIDKSGYGSQVTVYGNPTYKAEGLDGGYVLYYEGDSSYIRVLPPAAFLINKTMTVELMFKADELPADGTDLIAKYSEPPNSWRFGFRVSFQPDGKLWPEIYLVADNPADGDRMWNSLFLANDTRIEPNKWYRFMLEIGNDSVYVRLFDADSVLLDKNSMDITGQHVNLVGGMLTLGRSWWEPAPIFKGSFDNLHIYNYAVTEEATAIKEDATNGLPTVFQLYQNYPNPFNPETEIRFALPVNQDVQLVIYNLLGQKVKTLVDQKLNAGVYKFKWNGTDDNGQSVATGLYFVRMVTPKFTKVRKMVFIK